MRATFVTGCYRPVKRTLAARRALAAALIAGALVMPTVATAATCPRTTLGDVEDEVMCTVCGVPLNLATDAPQAARERAFIVSQIKQCRTKSQIKDQLVAQYGDRVLALPKAKGFGLTTYAVPIVGFLIAAALIAYTAIRWRGRRRPRGDALRTPEQQSAAALDPSASAQLEADLKRYDL